jgi:hypothetical protein
MEKMDGKVKKIDGENGWERKKGKEIEVWKP